MWKREGENERSCSDIEASTKAIEECSKHNAFPTRLRDT